MSILNKLNDLFIDSKTDLLVNKRIILRVDYNVPIKNNKVVDPTRIINSLKTINFLIEKNNDIILLTHLGRPKTEEDKLKYTTKTIFNFIKENNLFNCNNFEFIEDINIKIDYKGRNIYLVENVRFFNGETKNDLELAKKFANLGDIFVNDAFGSLHRVHSSVAGISNYLPTYFGLLVKEEILNLSKLLTPKRPYLIILGGAKVSDKLNLIKNLLTKCDKMVITGAACLTLYKSLNFNIGKSFFEETDVSNILNNNLIILPTEFIVVDNIDNPSYKIKKNIKDIGDNDIIVDALINEDIRKAILDSNTIFWNGPSGIFEKGYNEGSIEIAKLLSESNAFKVIGGGDTVNFINSTVEYKNKIDFISTGGGATLEFLEKETLDAIEYILKLKTTI
ncbi:MAG: phosphoglycerate kinase [bacterium]|nr:phosphoglycerate kinase [bacterium]